MTRIGILGGGQLGRMLAQAGAGLGIECRLLDPSPDACAGQVAPLVVGSPEDKATLSAFAEGLDVGGGAHDGLDPVGGGLAWLDAVDGLLADEA